MIGTWRWNAAFGGFGAALTLIFSLGNNPLLTTLSRTFYAFVVFILIAYAVRFILGLIHLPQPEVPDEAQPDEERGQNLDLVTPDEEAELSQMLKDSWTGGKDVQEAGFQPLTPTRLVSLDHPDPEEVAQAVRRLTSER